MKKLLVALMVLISFSALAQEGNKNSFGLIAGTGHASILRASLEGAPSLELKKNFELGATFYRELGEKLKLETGLFYHYNQLNHTSVFMPDVPQVNTQYDIHLIYLPAFLRLYLSEHFFISGGALVDVDLSNSLGLSSSNPLSNQSGLGASLGIGGELALHPNVLVQVNPYLNLHGGLPIKGEDYPERILDAGIKVGVRIK
ncbi:hypothetical protein [Nafulsella turpanensis]|uniref:hypothetical protein n=1 Tax=Nafulsella turpanensis TaxID=1265690 RepID=UPI000347A82E|nr:hypothetical protein [Nafulsella turpanensis]